MFALVARTFVQSYGERPSSDARLADWPDDPRLIDIEQVARILETTPAEVMVLVERGSIPFYVVPGLHRSDPAAYRFAREEIDDWVIG